MAKKKAIAVEDGLIKAAVVVGTALGELANKVGLGKAPAVAPKAEKKAPKKAVTSKPTASKKTVALSKKGRVAETGRSQEGRSQKGRRQKSSGEEGRAEKEDRGQEEVAGGV